MGDNELDHIPDTELAELRQNWDYAYRIWYEAGQFCAMRRDNGAIVRRGARRTSAMKSAAITRLGPSQPRPCNYRSRGPTKLPQAHLRP
jgi:hypothetical protein